jgi:hypothetical protein
MQVQPSGCIRAIAFVVQLIADLLYRRNRVPAAYQLINTLSLSEPGRVKVESRVSCCVEFVATPLPRRKCWENSQKSVCESVAVAAKIRYPDVSFFREQGETPIRRGWRGYE